MAYCTYTCRVSDQSLMTAIVRVYSKFVQKFLTKLILAQVQTGFNCILFEIPSKWAGSYCYCNQSTWSMIFDIFQLVQNIRTLYKTWAERLVKVSHTCTCSWDSTWIECRGLTKAYEPNSWPFLAAIRKQKTSEVWCNRTSPLSSSGSKDSRGRMYMYTFGSDVQKCTLMLGLGPTW